MSYEDIEATSAKEHADCKIIEKIIEIRTVVPENLCNTCFRSCFDVAFNSTKEYAALAGTTLQSYAPYILTFAAGTIIATLGFHKQQISAFVKGGVAMLFTSFQSKGQEVTNEAINKYAFSNVEDSYIYPSDGVNNENYLAAHQQEYKSESSGLSSPLGSPFTHEEINLGFEHQ